jgi:excisionase family DNA binding protein
VPDTSVVSPNRLDRRHPDAAAERRWASVLEVAAYLKITDQSVRNMLRDGRIVGYRGLGTRMLRIDLNQVDAVLESAC